MSNIVALEEVCEFLDNQRRPVTAKDRISGKYPYYGANGVQDYVDQYIFDDELVLLAEDGGHFDDPSKGVAYRVSGKCWVNNHAHVLKPKNNIDVDYLGYALRQYDVRPYITGAIVKKLNQNAARKILISVPSLADQRRIVKILDQADSLRQKRKQSIALLDEYLNSVFFEMFGDPVTNTRQWEEKPLEEIIETMTSGSRGWAKYYSEDGSIFLTIKNVGRNGRLLLKDISYVHAPDNAEAKRTKVKNGDVLLSITADIGRTAVVEDLPKEGYINQHLVILRLKNGYNSHYISHYLSTKGGQLQMQRLNKGASKSGLNFNDIRSIKTQIPPMDLQNKFAEIIRNTQTLKNKMLLQSEELENQFQALMHKSFLQTYEN